MFHVEHSQFHVIFLYSDKSYITMIMVMIYSLNYVSRETYNIYDIYNTYKIKLVTIFISNNSKYLFIIHNCITYNYGDYNQLFHVKHYIRSLSI